MKYSILTPTYNRPVLLRRCIESLISQKHENWEMVIVNDSPEFDYTDIEKYIKEKNDNRIKYFVNKNNSGVNFTRNFAMWNISEESMYTIFLDDDDFLYPDALENIDKILIENNYTWLVTNRAHQNKKLVNIKGKIKSKYNYFWDALIFKNFTGDVTHTIKTEIAKKGKFSTVVKQGEEWTYFIQLPPEMSYVDINTTNTDGYLDGGLTDILKNKYKENTRLLWQGNWNLKIFIILILREINSLLRK